MAKAKHRTISDLEKLLEPATIRKNLALCSLYLLAYELLNYSIIDRTRDFFVIDLPHKPIGREDYEAKVRRLHGNLLEASCLWLKGNGVITSEEVEEIRKIKKHRDKIAHMGKMADPSPELLFDSSLGKANLDFLSRMKELLHKIVVWWVAEVYIPTNPDFDAIEVDPADIQVPVIWLLDHLLAAAMDSRTT